MQDINNKMTKCWKGADKKQGCCYCNSPMRMRFSFTCELPHSWRCIYVLSLPLVRKAILRLSGIVNNPPKVESIFYPTTKVVRFGAIFLHSNHLYWSGKFWQKTGIPPTTLKVGESCPIIVELTSILLQRYFNINFKTTSITVHPRLLP